jgi:hypothetical protein
MSVPAIAAIGSFVVLFTMWVVLPSRLKKRHENKEEE